MGEERFYFTKGTSPGESARIRNRPIPTGFAISFCNSLHDLHCQKENQARPTMW
jgi:hypothetical protein